MVSVVRCLELSAVWSCPLSVVWSCPLFRGFYNRDFNYKRSGLELTVRYLEVSVV